MLITIGCLVLSTVLFAGQASDAEESRENSPLQAGIRKTAGLTHRNFGDDERLIDSDRNAIHDAIRRYGPQSKETYAAGAKLEADRAAIKAGEDNLLYNEGRVSGR